LQPGTIVITRMLGALLAAMSMQVVIDGVKGTGLIGCANLPCFLCLHCETNQPFRLAR
jgi:hypothetical protein